jgi:hypothetical protein
MFDRPNKDIIPYFKKGGKVQIINKSVIKKKKMKQKQTQKQIVNIYNTKPAQRKRVYKKTDDKKNDQQQRMPVYYTQPQYNQYLPAPTITMHTKLPTMTADTKLPQAFERSSVLPTSTGLSTGLKSKQDAGTNPDFDAEFNDYMNDKQIYEDEREKMKRKQKEIIDFFRNTPYKDEPLPSILEGSNILPNFNYGRERLPPPNPIKPPQPEYKDPSAFSEFDDEDYINPPEEEPTLSSDLPANKRYSRWSYDQLKEESINKGLYLNTTQPKRGQQKYDEFGNIVKRGEIGYDKATRPKTKDELKDALYQYDREKN